MPFYPVLLPIPLQYSVFLGQDASNLARSKGFHANQYTCGEIVSANRSHGGKTVGEVVSINRSVLCVSFGGRLKDVPVDLLSSLVGKLIGARLHRVSRALRIKVK
jgi:hypothetical protein